MDHETKREGCVFAEQGDNLAALFAICACENNEFWHFNRLSTVVCGSTLLLSQGNVRGIYVCLIESLKGSLSIAL